MEINMPGVVSYQDHVQVTDRHALHCAKKEAVATCESPFKLGPLDEMVFISLPIECIFVYRKPKLSPQNKLIPIELLRQSLSHLLDYYPHLTGRLQTNLDTRAPEIARIGTGTELLEAQCGLRLDDFVPKDRASGRILITDLPGCGSDLTPSFDTSIDGVCRDPIFAVQHTRFACGGVALGIWLRHVVCDASGLFQLTRDFAELYRGLSSSSQPTLACPPVIHSYLRDVDVLTPKERQEAAEYQPAAYYYLDEGSATTNQDVDEMKNPDSPKPDPPMKPPKIGRVLRFSGEDLLVLKKQAIDPSGKGWVSTFEALCAYLYQRIYRARVQLLNSEDLWVPDAPGKISRGFLASINMRSPNRLNLPPKYFPNAIYFPHTILSHELLAYSPLWEVAKTLHAKIREVDAYQMEQTTRWTAVHRDKSRIKVNYNFVGDGNFVVTQWSGFRMYVGVDFDVDGQGRPIPPVLVSPPLSPVDGSARILSTEEDFYYETKGSGQATSAGKQNAVAINLTLTEPLWLILGEDEQFRKHFP